MSRRASIRTGVILLLALAAAGVFAVASRADDPRFGRIESSLQPNIVNAGSTVLYKALWEYIDSRTLVHSAVVITVPDGWTLVPPSAPTGCTQTGRTITCNRGTIRPGDVIQQAVELQTDADLGSQPVTSFLQFYEGPRNPGRAQQKDAPLQSTTVIDPAAEPDRAGACLDENETVSTLLAHGGSSTQAEGPQTGELCTPVSIEERARTDPQEACLPDLECVEDIITTNAPQVTGPPIELTLVFYGNGLINRSLIFTSGTLQAEVGPCPGDPCFTNHVGRGQSVTWSVNWSGIDPEWTG